ncbi:hypothetical protein EI94DRAFT_1697339 [Lactarius quietus]|nr:hypothetical protein EI94DRAFT_1697339 [Lactarius quietus]
MSKPPECQMGNIATSVCSFTQRTPHDPNQNGHNTACDPLDNYTNAKMPKVHDTHPTSPFKYIDLNLITHNSKLHNVIKNYILYAVAEITHSQGIGVSAPTPSDDAVDEDHFQSSFLA